MAVTKASCLSDIHSCTGLPNCWAHCLALLTNRRTSAVALESNASANQTRLARNSRTTENKLLEASIKLAEEELPLFEKSMPAELASAEFAKKHADQELA